MIGTSRKRARLEEKADPGPLVSLQTIFSLADETRRCFVEGEAVYNASHTVFCGIREATDDMLSIEGLCLQPNGVTSQPHCVNVCWHCRFYKGCYTSIHARKIVQAHFTNIY